MTADIITIGDEILIGQVLDTNSQFIATEFTKSGIAIKTMLSISDKENEIINALEHSVGKVDFIVITGGLGPTNDDITKNTLLKYFGGTYKLHHESLQLITEFFAKRGREVTERNHQQALVPSSCTVLLNKWGTAPGMMFERQNTLIFSLPGVPFEMKELLTNDVLPTIQKKFTLPVLLFHTILIEGIPESNLADKLKSWEDNLSEKIKVAYLPSPGIIRLRLSIAGDNNDDLEKSLKVEIQKVIQLIGNRHIFGFNQDTLAEVLGRVLTEKKLSIAIAESCTGGNISHLITSVPGCSNYFKGSIIAYSNEIKTAELGIEEEIIIKYGAVSREVVESMVKGVQKKLKSECAIATTGIAGPDGGTTEKPVGTVWIAALYGNKIISEKFLFGDNRERNIIRSSLSALNMLRNLVEENG